MHHFRAVLPSAVAFCSVFFLASDAQAQIPPSTSTTSTPVPGAGHDYLGGLAETVNPANGSVSLRIPVVIPPGRGITLPFSFAYDSNGVNYVSPNGGGILSWVTPTSSIVAQAGWSDSVPIVNVAELTWTATMDGGRHEACFAFVNYVFQDPIGNRHNLNLTNYKGNTQSDACTYDTSHWPSGFGGQIVTQGGEGPILATIPTNGLQAGPVTVTDGDGTVYYFPNYQNDSYGSAATSVTDRNGNYVTINPPGSASSPYSYVDTAGRTVLQDSGFATSPETVTVAGLGAPYTLTWTTLATPSFTAATTTLSGNCSNTMTRYAWNSTNDHAISSLTLPNGQSFSFTYNATYGLLNKITYPTGGYIRYVWGMNSQAEYGQNSYIQQPCSMLYAMPVITDRYVSFDGSTEVLHQQFAYSTSWHLSNYNYYWTSKQTTVTTTDNVRNTTSRTIYTYSPSVADDPPNTGGGPTAQDPVEASVAYYDTSGSLLKTVTKTWQNVRLLSSQENTFPNGQASETTWSYNTNEMQIEQDDYDFGTTAPPNPPGPLLRKTATSYATFGTNHIVDKPSKVQTYDSTRTNLVAETDYSYDQTTPTTTSNVLQHSGGCKCGNVTTKAAWVNGSGSTLSTTYTYDDTGQTLSMTDPRSNETTYSYTDSFTSGGPSGGVTNAYLTTVTHPQTSGVNHIEKYAYAYASGEVTSSTDQNNLVTTYKYVDNLARLTETDFPDGGTTTIAYNDAAYNPSTPSPSVTTTKRINATTSQITVSASDGLLHGVRTEVSSDPQGTVYRDTTYDGLGRADNVSNPYRSGTDATSSPGTTTFNYDSLGRKISETAPDASVITTAYCAGSTLVTDSTSRWRRSRTDGLGRLVEVDEPNAVGASVASTGCPGTGEPIWVTGYTVDTLGNLRQIVQNGSHQRTFTYDFLSRLTSANNPESGNVTYNYDSDTNCTTPNSFAGLLVSKVDARNIRTCAQYDALNRETSLSYSNGDTSLSFSYDQASCLNLAACQNIGHRTSMTDGAGSEAWAFDVDPTNVRSIHQEQRTTNSSPSNVQKTTTYYFDLAGNLTQLVYPTGRIVNYTYDAANRPSTAADASNGITYATDWKTPPPSTNCTAGAVCYTPQGSVYTMSIGQTSSFTGFNVSETFSNRLQPNELKASSTAGNAIDITYNFVDPTSHGNAGHVYSITNNLNSGRGQSFTYDQLNRITSAGTTATSGSYCWGYQFIYDAWANLESQAGWTPTYNSCTESIMGAVTANGNNQLPGFSYDFSGNALGDGNYSYTWNAESQMRTAGGVTYSYDGDGRRASKVGSKLYWYGSGGEILAETDASGNTLNEYVFFGGKRVADVPATGSALYYAEDMLGSSRVIVQSNGTLCYDADFTPFGGERIVTNTCLQNYKFEGKERDSETGNDDFGAREYSWRFGRWLSADWSAVPVPVPYANLTNPQTLNLYAMVADDPESFADLDGHTPGDGRTCPPPASGQKGQAGTSCTTASDQSQATGAQATAQNQSASTMPLAPPAPIVLPALGEAAKDLVGGLIETLAAPLIILDYLISPGTTATEDKDTVHAPILQSGPKAADAPGVTAGGQATDAHGNKLGPSGETQIDRTRSNTREGARNRALGEGSGAVEHSNPRVGSRHWHPTDAQGNKKPSSTHHEYPDE